MVVRSQRNMLDKLGIDSRGEPWWFRPQRRSRIPWMRAWAESRRYQNFPAINATARFGVTFNRNSVATFRDSANNVVVVPAHRERFLSNFGIERTLLHVEGARTNFLLNSTAPATQTTGSLGLGTYTLWLDGPGTVTIAAGTAVITNAGAATAGSPRVITVTTAGTVTCTVSGGTPTRFQLENGGFPTSFIPTAGATVTRAADALLWVPAVAPGGTGLFLSPGASGVGTIIGQFRLPQVNAGADQTILSIDTGADTNRVTVTQPTGGATLALRVLAGGTQNVNLAAGVTVVANTFYRFALSWGPTNAWSFVLTGGTVQTATGAGPSGLTTVRFGSLVTAGSEANGFVGLVERINARLTNAQLLDAVRNV